MGKEVGFAKNPRPELWPVLEEHHRPPNHIFDNRHIVNKHGADMN